MTFPNFGHFPLYSRPGKFIWIPNFSRICTNPGFRYMSWMLQVAVAYFVHNWKYLTKYANSHNSRKMWNIFQQVSNWQWQYSANQQMDKKITQHIIGFFPNRDKYLPQKHTLQCQCQIWAGYMLSIPGDLNGANKDIAHLTLSSVTILSAISQSS